MKKGVVLYDSRFGNTEKIAKPLARGMEKQGVKVDCFKVDEVDVQKLVEYDFLAVGGPTHARAQVSEKYVRCKGGSRKRSYSCLIGINNSSPR